MKDEATLQDKFGLAGDCPLCMSKLLPVWEEVPERMPCCGILICQRCQLGRMDYVMKNKPKFDRMPKHERDQVMNACGLCPFCREKTVLLQEELLKKNSQDGHGWADYELYNYYSRDWSHMFRGPPQPNKAFEHLKLAAERGYPLALIELGRFYAIGDNQYNIEASTLNARWYFLEAATQGHAEGRHGLALTFLSDDNNGTARDEEEDVDTAIEHLKLAAREGYYYSYRYLGNLHLPEVGVKENINIALYYYRKGAEFREENSLFKLGFICKHKHAQFIPNNTFDQSDDEVVNFVNDNPHTAAVVLFELSARQGHYKSQIELSTSLGHKFKQGRSPRAFVAYISWISISRYHEEAMEEYSARLQLPLIKDTGATICFNCLKSNTSEKKFSCCSRCKAAWYCCKACQIKHYKECHKNICGGYHIKRWTREDALKKTINPYYVGIDPPQEEDQLATYRTMINTSSRANK